MSEPPLADLLRTASTASRFDRINYRDAIASHGAAAIEAIKPWLADPSLAAFAVRVIARAGAQGSQADAVRAFNDARGGASDVIRGDIDAALDSLGARRPSTNAAGPAAKPIEISDNLYV